MQDEISVRRALISVSDKSGLVELGRALADCGGELLSTGGTARALQDAGIEVRDVADYTGFPEMMGGRVKTLHPKIHGGLLALRDKPEHRHAMEAHDIGAIDLIVVNLYPFEKSVAAGAAPEEIIENIDIGGPAMIRSAAKNHRYVAVVVDPADYPRIIDELSRRGGKIGLALRRELAAKAFARTARYDSAIGRWFAMQEGETPSGPLLVTAGAPVPLRYGENPHQRAAFYPDPMDKRPGAARARQLNGKPLSYNNLNDADAAFELVSEIGQRGPAVAIIKHANPCGAAIGESLADAYGKALRCDPVSAFGGVVALSRTLDAETATLIAGIFTEVVVAPGIDAEALEILTAKKNLRVLEAGALADPEGAGRAIRTLTGGYLVQDRDSGRVRTQDLKTVTRRAPSEGELADLLFAFRVAKHVKSNAIVYAKGGATVGIGAGQMSRLDSARIAAEKASDASRAAGLEDAMTKGSVVASDAFFPFADGLLAAVEAGAEAVIQPGGSIRDDEVIAAADEAGIAMVFTGMRHFRH